MLWDAGGSGPDGGAGRAANELTVTDWDPVSKQPLFKTAAARLTRIAGGDGPSAAPTTAASRPVSGGAPPTSGGPAGQVVERVAEPAGTGGAPS